MAKPVGVGAAGLAAQYHHLVPPSRRKARQRPHLGATASAFAAGHCSGALQRAVLARSSTPGA